MSHIPPEQEYSIQSHMVLTVIPYMSFAELSKSKLLHPMFTKVVKRWVCVVWNLC